MIVLTRVDNRLIHGQVATGWLRSCDANICIVANDRVAESAMEQNLLSMAVAQMMPVRFLPVAVAAEKIARADPRRRIALIVEDPIDLEGLMEAGLDLAEVNIGNMHMAEGKVRLCKTVWADADELAALRRVRGRGVRLEYRLLPGDASVDMAPLLDAALAPAEDEGR